MLGRVPGEPAESILTMPCPALCSPRTRFSLGGRWGIRAVDEGGDRAASKKCLTAVFVSLLLTFEMVSVTGRKGYRVKKRKERLQSENISPSTLLVQDVVLASLFCVPHQKVFQHTAPPHLRFVLCDMGTLRAAP